MRILFLSTFLFLLAAAAFSQQKLPAEIKGNWLNAADSIEWLYSFQPGFAVCETQFWEYKSINQNGNEYKLLLVSGKEEKLLSVKVIDNTSLQITAEGKSPIRCTNQKARKPDFRNYDTQEFKEPILVDDTATISGFIEDYDPEIFSKTGSVEYYSVLTGTGDDSKTEFQIQPDGRFTLKFRMFNPQNVWLHIDGSTQTTVFIKPGETVFVCFNKLLKVVTIDERKWKELSDYQINHYMGKSGLLSEEMIVLNTYYNSLKPILKKTNMEIMPQLTYQKWRKQTCEKDLQGLDSVANAMNCSAKARQVMEITANLSCLEDLLRYPVDNRTNVQFSQKYIDRLPESNSAPELNLLYSDYHSYVVYQYWFYEQQIFGDISHAKTAAYMNLFLKNTNDTSDQRVIRDWQSKYSAYSWPELSDRLDKEDRINDSTLLKSTYSYFRPYYKMADKYWGKISDGSSDSIYIYEFNFVLDKFNSDITGQMFCMYYLSLIQQSEVLNISYVNWAKQRITNPVLLNYLLETRKAKEEQKLKYSAYASGTHFIDSIDCDKNSDAFFTEILKKFEGKVVYIDFWADWCSPCRAEFEPAAKLKQDYADKDIVFLYLGISCKKNLWEAMIKEKQIEGYHYWLNNEQGSVLQRKFNFKGIPHFVLVDKTGKVLEGETPRPSSKVAIREKLNELLN